MLDMLWRPQALAPMVIPAHQPTSRGVALPPTEPQAGRAGAGAGAGAPAVALVGDALCRIALARVLRVGMERVAMVDDCCMPAKDAFTLFTLFFRIPQMVTISLFNTA